MKNFLRTVERKLGILLNVLENKPSSPSTSVPTFPAGNNKSMFISLLLFHVMSSS